MALVSDRTQPRVLVSYNGCWGENVNATTSDEEADLGGQATFQSNWVGVERISSSATDRSGSRRDHPRVDRRV